MLTKEEKKQMLKALKEEEAQRFEASLPMTRRHFEGLFDYLDEKLTTDGCDESPNFTVEYLRRNGIDEEPVLLWLRENGGYCDCEVLANVEELFL